MPMFSNCELSNGVDEGVDLMGNRVGDWLDAWISVQPAL